jgi:3-deoxy-D-manno-octulosonic-acid transferase
VFLVWDVLYRFILVLAVPALLCVALVRPRRRRDLLLRLGTVPRRVGAKKCLWVHGVSVGEVLAGRTLVDGFRARHRDWDVVVSTTTRTGHETARRTYPDCTVISYPLDLTWAVRRAFSRVRPDLVVLLELELWPNFVRIASRLGVPVVIANGRLSDRSRRLQRMFRFILAPSCARIERVCAQTEEYARRFVDVGVPPGRVAVTGSLKYDSVPAGAGDAEDLRRLLRIAGDEKLIVAGSTAPGEEELLLDAYARLRTDFPSLRLLLVPRHPERFDEVASLIRAKGFACLRRSGATGTEKTRTGPESSTCLAPSSPQSRLSCDVVILGDTMGELVRFYALADVVFVGKSLVPPGGGQNIIEPAALGKPVVFGPHMANFRETRDMLLKRRAAREVAGPGELYPALKDLLREEQAASQMGLRARAAIDAARGATARTLDIIDELLASRPGPL